TCADGSASPPWFPMSRRIATSAATCGPGRSAVPWCTSAFSAQARFCCINRAREQFCCSSLRCAQGCSIAASSATSPSNLRTRRERYRIGLRPLRRRGIDRLQHKASVGSRRQAALVLAYAQSAAVFLWILVHPCEFAANFALTAAPATRTAPLLLRFPNPRDTSPRQ